MTTNKKLHDITSKAASPPPGQQNLDHKQEKILLQKMETSKTTFLGPLFGLTILDCQSNCDNWHWL